VHGLEEKFFQFCLLKPLTIPGKEDFEWIPFFRAIAERILDFKVSRKELGDLVLVRTMGTEVFAHSAFT